MEPYLAAFESLMGVVSAAVGGALTVIGLVIGYFAKYLLDKSLQRSGRQADLEEQRKNGLQRVASRAAEMYQQSHRYYFCCATLIRESVERGVTPESRDRFSMIPVPDHSGLLVECAASAPMLTETSVKYIAAVNSLNASVWQASQEAIAISMTENEAGRLGEELLKVYRECGAELRVLSEQIGAMLAQEQSADKPQSKPSRSPSITESETN